ncbi:MAG: hypothetical protein A1D16_14005 [Flavihumibacter sp. CACIAM 22H1]|nr:MAG: hypothetical protein A1D16_14005 [Flavihumibacter sp. CACIAM 22H1]
MLVAIGCRENVFIISALCKLQEVFCGAFIRKISFLGGQEFDVDDGGRSMLFFPTLDELWKRDIEL